MFDRLSITDLELWTRIGVTDQERQADQRVLVTVEMTLDTSTAAKDDDVKRSMNYFDVSEDLKELVKTERKTIERLAHDVADLILKNHQPETVTVTVKKFAIPGAANVSITIRR